jgi:CRISPR/Cas system CSM-associated protein Csm3 (group 7 of RAMP superfamily)
MSDRLRIVLEAELRSPLHILGPGRHVALVDRPVELDAQGYPIIPASSMRGRIRAHLERLLRQMGQPVCAPPSPEQMCPHAGHDGYCMACRVFGSPWRPAAMVSSDLRLVAPRPDADLLRSERTSVGISRRLGTAQAERLFTIETVDTSFGAAKLVFEGEMVGQATPEEAGWLLAAVPLVTHLGGSKARGLGGISLRAKEVCWWREGEWQSADVNRLIEEVLDHATT